MGKSPRGGNDGSLSKAKNAPAANHVTSQFNMRGFTFAVMLCEGEVSF